MLNAKIRHYDSPLGRLYIAVHENRIFAISFSPLKELYLHYLLERPGINIFSGMSSHLFRQLNLYFSGKNPCFDLPLTVHGSSFEQNVWKACLRIPYGETRSYLDLAKAIGNPNAARAVGGALSRNPIPLIIPCHRVISSDGGLGGFTGGLPIKKKLLDLEKGST